jgi:serine phosphatase RsbU (regulator of sigma subunit)
MDIAGVLRRLLADSQQARPEDLPDIVDRLAGYVGAVSMTMYVADLSQRVLVPLGQASTDREPVPVDGTVAGRAYVSVSSQQVIGRGDAVAWLPLCNGADRIGVLQVVARPHTNGRITGFEEVATLIGELLASRTFYSDLMERTRRQSRMSVPAELLRAQLPPLTFATSRLTISGILEPCYRVGGDAFDYAVNGEIAHLALFDAVGHGGKGGLRAAILASVAIAAYRNARRGGYTLADTYRHIDAVVRDHDLTGLITAVLAELDQTTGRLQAIWAGHPAGYLLRAGAVVKAMPTPTALPVTMGDLVEPSIAAEQLEPGDQLLLYTDGVIEARDRDGAFFGADRLIAFAERAAADGLSLPETTRRLVHAILEYQADDLQDDATVLMIQWN